MSEKNFELGIVDVQVQILDETLAIVSGKPLRAISSAILNGGLNSPRSIINHLVPKSFSPTRPEEVLEGEAARLRLPKPVVGLMTAVDVTRPAIAVRKSDDLVVATLTTAGLSYPAAAGDRVRIEPAKASTINIITLVDGNLSDECLVDAVKTATEAKTLACRNLDVRSRFSERVATGTTTDAVVIACTRRGQKLRYSGPATTLGQMLASTVYETVVQAIGRYEGVTKQRPMLKRLEERGIKLKHLVETGMELYVTTGRSEQTRRQTSHLLKLELLRALDDKNVVALIIAALRLEEDGAGGLIPGLPRKEYLSDPPTLVADESLGMAIANYLGGTWGIHNFLYYERHKPGIIEKLGPFLDDAIAGLVAGTFSRLEMGRGH